LSTLVRLSDQQWINEFIGVVLHDFILQSFIFTIELSKIVQRLVFWFLLLLLGLRCLVFILSRPFSRKDFLYQIVIFQKNLQVHLLVSFYRFQVN
jgi:hypothetical protein